MGATVTRGGQSARPDAALAERLAVGPPLLLDGATGTELERRGVRSTLPLWSAHALLEAPEVVLRIHLDYVEAGAEILTANTFRTQTRTLARAYPTGAAALARELTARALALARSAAARPAGRRVWVAGSLPPLEDCWRPELAPPDAELAHEHGEQARSLADAGADLLLVETHNSVREAVAAARAARATGLPIWVSFACDGAARLLSGEPLAAAIDAVAAAAAPELVGVNCLPPPAADAALPVLVACGRPFFVYANLGAPDPAGGEERTHERTPAAYAAEAGRWLRAGARAVGGCCGTTPAHVRALAERLAAG